MAGSAHSDLTPGPPSFTRRSERPKPGHDFIARSTERDPVVAAQDARMRRAYLRNLRRPGVIVYAILTGLVAFVDLRLVVFLAALGMIWVIAAADHESGRDWWPSMLGVLGLEPAGSRGIPHRTPLLRAIAKGIYEVGPVLSGRDHRRQLVMIGGTNSSGASDHEDRVFTAVVFTAAVSPSVGFLCAGPSLTTRDRLDAHNEVVRRAAKARSDAHRFTVESSELHDRFEFRCTEHDLDTARHRFTPSFMAWFTEHGLPFECENGYLVVYVPHRLTHRGEFRDLLARADHIHAALGGT